MDRLTCNRQRYRLLAAIFMLLGGVLALFAGSIERTQAQEPTAIQFEFPSATPTQGPPTETPTRTATPLGRPQAEAAGEYANLRSGPGTDETIAGKIYPGTKYYVRGRLYDWYWIEVPEIPGGTAWVYYTVVNITGEESSIPILEALPTADPGVLSAQQTALAISATPGGGATLTAQANITPTGVFTAAPGSGDTGQNLQGPPPTFTPIEFTVTPIPFPRENPPPETGGLAPIVPILALGSLGLMGLLVAILRRL